MLREDVAPDFRELERRLLYCRQIIGLQSNIVGGADQNSLVCARGWPAGWPLTISLWHVAVDGACTFVLAVLYSAVHVAVAV